MQPWCLDSHPLLASFHNFIPSVTPPANTYFHLFLTPPYAQPRQPSQDYFFSSSHANPSHLVKYVDHSASLVIKENTIVSRFGFPTPFEMKILMTSPCSSGILQFIIYEVDNDIYNQVPVPPMCDMVLRAANQAAEAQRFLGEQVTDSQVRAIWGSLSAHVLPMRVTAESREEFLAAMRDGMDNLATALFENREIASLPIGIKRQLNLLIFNAVSAKAHFMLMMAFSSAYEVENRNAQRASRAFQQTIKIDVAKMDRAVRQFHGILHLPNPVAIIDSLVVFFDAIVDALPGVEVAADDLLPAICLAMTRDVSFGSHVVSFFNYLTEIWPPVGMDERVTYILVTCSIAAQHLASMPSNESAPKSTRKVDDAQPRRSSGADRTVDLLEDLLNII